MLEISRLYLDAEVKETLFLPESLRQISRKHFGWLRMEHSLPVDRYIGRCDCPGLSDVPTPVDWEKDTSLKGKLVQLSKEDETEGM